MHKEQATSPIAWCTALTVATFALSIFLFPARVPAQSFELVKTFTSPTPKEERSAFGASVALHGALALIGAPYAEGDVGHAYLFDVKSGKHLGTLRNPSPGPKASGEGFLLTGDDFGLAVALSKDYALVSAPGENAGAPHSGVVYLFDIANLRLHGTIANPTPDNFERFGSKLTVQGNHVSIAPIFERTNSGHGGAVYVFEVKSGRLIHTLTSPAPKMGLHFGESVALSEEFILVGEPWAPSFEADQSASGAVHLFRLKDGKLIRTIKNPTLIRENYFGSPVALSHNHALVGAHVHENSGAAYVFDATSGQLLHVLKKPSPEINDWFGSPMALGESYVVVAASGDDATARDSGAAYVFELATGDLQQVINNPMPTEGDLFGETVACGGSYCLFGNVNKGPFGTGIAYLFKASP